MRDEPSGLILQVEPQEFVYIPYAAREMLNDAERYRDICGQGIDKVMARVGWKALRFPISASLAQEDTGRVVCVGWCMPIQWATGKLGINLSYATDPLFTGRGLASAAASLAYIETFDQNPIMLDWDVNIQCDATNTPAIAVARSLGFEPCVDASFTVPHLGRSYLGFTVSGMDFYERCNEILYARTQNTPFERSRP